jgi:glycosyltransferase involved in cell wall biosynthesis
MKLILSHPTGNANVRAAAKGLKNSDQLLKFFTTIAAYPGSTTYRMGGISMFSEIRRRGFDESLKAITETRPLTEAIRLLALKAKFSGLVKNETGRFSIDSVYRDLDKYVARKLKKLIPEIQGVYCYEDGALETFRYAKNAGLKCIYDLPIGYWRASQKVLELEGQKRPAWRTTLGGLSNSAEKLARKDEELDLADKIFVASSFTAKTLADYPGRLSSVSIVPYGFPVPFSERTYQKFGSRPLKVLFVGGLSQRKGIAELFEAVDTFRNHVVLTVVGGKPRNDCPALNEALSKHKWIPSLPNQSILALMQQNDLLVFPSLFEGFGLVVTEAMAQGTPVITTNRTCGADLIKHGENGWLIDSGSTESLKERIEACLMRPNEIAEVGRQALDTAIKRPWANYETELANAVASS